MNIKKTAKKIVAVSAGIGLAGATLMSAMAAAPDLANYPSDFIVDGQFDGKIVVGAAAASQDIIGAIDIASSLQAASTSPVEGGDSTTVVEGDAKQVAEPGDMLEIGEKVSDVLEILSGDDLEMLSSGRITNRRGSTDYTQTLEIASGSVANHGVVGVFEQRLRDGSRNIGDFLRFGNDDLFVYELDFTSGLRSNTQEISGGNLWDLRDLKDQRISMLGQSYTIVGAEWHSGDGTIEMTLMAGDVSDTLEQGQTRTYSVDGQDYEVTVLIVGQSGDDNTVRFLVNGEVTDTLRVGDTDTLSNGMEIGVQEVIRSNRAFEGDQGSLVEFYLGANKVVFKHSGDVEIGNENINTASVDIQHTATGTSQVRINNIKYTLGADYEYRSEAHLAAGQGLAQFLRYPEAMLNSGWDIVYEGLSQPAHSLIEFDPRGDDEYELTFTNRRGDTFSIPFLYARQSDQTVYFGSDQERLLLDESNEWDHIAPDEYFVVTHNGADSAGDTYVLEWTDVNTNDNILRFSHAATGAEIVSSYTTAYNRNDTGASPQVQNVTSVTGVDLNNPSGNILLGGRSFDFWLSHDGGENYRLAVDMNNDKALTSTGVNIVTRGGGILSFTATGGTDVYNRSGPGAASVTVSLQTLEKNIDDGTETEGVETSWTFNAPANGEVDLSARPTSNNTYTLYEQKLRNVDQYLGMDRYGAKYHTIVESNSPDTLRIEYPHSQVEPQVFIVGGAVSTRTVATGGAAQVNVLPVGIAVLDSDVSFDQDNMIVVGGPCANTIAAELLGNPTDCAEGFTDGMGVIQSFDTGDNFAILVAGYSAQDTVESSRVLARAATETVPSLSGTSVEVVVAGANDVSVRAPSN